MTVEDDVFLIGSVVPLLAIIDMYVNCQATASVNLFLSDFIINTSALTKQKWW